MKEPILVIMAAGMGSRYGGLKQMDKVTPTGEVILDYSIFDAKRAGFKRVIFLIKINRVRSDLTWRKEIISCANTDLSVQRFHCILGGAIVKSHKLGLFSAVVVADDTEAVAVKSIVCQLEVSILQYLFDDLIKFFASCCFLSFCPFTHMYSSVLLGIYV